MAEQTDPRLQRAMDVIVRIQRIDNPKTIKAFEPFLRKDAALLLEAIDGPAPDWADLREMARNAGYRFHREGEGLRWDGSRWDVLHQAEKVMDGKRRFYLERVGTHEGYVSVSLRSDHAEVHVTDPTPAEVLTAARLVGLIGGTS